MSSLWCLVRDWRGFLSVYPLQISDHFIMFGNGACVSKPRRNIMQLIWLSCTWVIRKEKKNIIFNNKISSTHRLLEQIKLFSFWWLKAHNPHLKQVTHLVPMSFCLFGHWLMSIFFFCVLWRTIIFWLNFVVKILTSSLIRFVLGEIFVSIDIYLILVS